MTDVEVTTIDAAGEQPTALAEHLVQVAVDHFGCPPRRVKTLINTWVQSGILDIDEGARGPDYETIKHPPAPPVRTDYTREELIAICERGAVPVAQWFNRDSAGAQRQLGEAWILLRAGNEFHVRPEKPNGSKSGTFTDDRTIWVDIDWPGFDTVEAGGPHENGTFYLPTPARLDQADGGDWY